MPPDIRCGRDGAEAHGEEWVMEHYYREHPLGVITVMPEKEALPCYDADVNTTLTESEPAKIYRQRVEYLENLRTASRPE